MDTYVAQLRQADARSRAFTRDACKGRETALFYAVDGLTRAIRLMREAGASEREIERFKDAASDAVNDTLGKIQKDADNDGVPPEEFEVSLAELEAA